MATNFIQTGKNLDFVAPTGGVVSGQGILLGPSKSGNVAQDSALQGGVFGIVQGSAAEGEDAVMSICGVYEMTKAESEAISQWDSVYWDDVNEAVTAVNSNNFKRIGVAVLESVAGGGNTSVTVQLRKDSDGSGDNLIINYVATATHVAGEPFLLEQGSDRMVAVPLKGGDSGDNIPVLVAGPVELEKAAVDIAAYDKVFWDDSNNVITDVSASGLVECGYALKAAASGASFVQIRLKDDFVTPVA